MVVLNFITFAKHIFLAYTYNMYYRTDWTFLNGRSEVSDPCYNYVACGFI